MGLRRASRALLGILLFRSSQLQALYQFCRIEGAFIAVLHGPKSDLELEDGRGLP